MADRSDLDPEVPANADVGQASGLNLSPDDPLRKWFQDLNDPGMAALMVSDPERAKELMISRGIPPPPHAQPFAGEDRGGSILGYDPSKDPTRAAPSFGGGRPKEGIPDPTADQGPVVLNPSGVRPAGTPIPAPRPEVPVPPANPLDPEEEEAVATPAKAGLPRARPAEAPPADTDVSAKKKDVAGALSGFSQSLAGVKPIQPPPVNAVGTPSVRSPSAVNAPNIANLLALAGQQAHANQLATLGRLLVAGKA